MVKCTSSPLLDCSYHASSASEVIGRSRAPSVRVTSKSLIHRWYSGSRSRRTGPSATFSPLMLRMGCSDCGAAAMLEGLPGIYHRTKDHPHVHARCRAFLRRMAGPWIWAPYKIMASHPAFRGNKGKGYRIGELLLCQRATNGGVCVTILRE